MDKRYQVFVSSTYEDLRTERQEVMHALLELDCIPSGMELFPADDDDQWSLIKRLIDECDYYIVICAGRYGSISPSGIGYTEMEYRYALDSNKPTLAFLHKSPQQLVAANCEQNDEGRGKLNSFRSLLSQKMCKHWENASELGSVVSRSLIRLIKTKPAVGWVRSNEITDGLAASEILRLKRQVEELALKLVEAKNMAPIGTEGLAQGNEKYPIQYNFESTLKFQNWTWERNLDLSWDEIFYDIGPVMLDKASELKIRKAMNTMVNLRSENSPETDELLKNHTDLRNFSITDHDFQTIMIQLRALKLIIKNENQRSVKDNLTYWSLTPYGDSILTTLRAIKKTDDSIDSNDLANDKIDSISI